MWIKPLIVILMVALIISLTRAGYFLFKDKGNTESQRVNRALYLRVSLATLLIVTVAYGLLTGQLVISAPWHPTTSF